MNAHADNERLSAWIRDYAAALHGFLTASTGDRHQAEDLLQETFCRVWEARRRYVEAGSERAYLWRIADRLARDWSRRQRSRRPGQNGRREQPVDDECWQRIEPTDPAPPADDALLRTEHESDLNLALDLLSESQRCTLLLRYYSDLEFAEIATILECPVNTVFSHARRGLLALRRVLLEKNS